MKLKKRVYEIFNVEQGKAGAPFTMCDSCYKDWYPKIRSKLIVEKVANDSVRICNECSC